ncbi:magnesium-translocating P-type ATPase [Gordonia sp. TBRC 11910]|uniref:Magnesium-transporting ATPase, P-type 1 n=1 Tax=Gordonia asplenii TaxID=2725283 RepID=A0A848KSP5_9ACTN|nr:magnesium-translocating P-type ATPase [Gordonia asplenii]NMO01027.1 magnesium-translocating P-type ATPase [Gordonia asplenii]
MRTFRSAPTTLPQQPRQSADAATGERRLPLHDAVTRSADDVVAALHSDATRGLSSQQVIELRNLHGPNVVHHQRPEPALSHLARTCANPFILILCGLAVVMTFTDVIMPADPDYTGVATIAVMVAISVGLRFWQERRTSRVAERLATMVATTTTVTRTQLNGYRRPVRISGEVPIADVVPGDLVTLAAGDMIPADIRFLSVNSVQVNQSMLTGESEPAEKTTDALDEPAGTDLLAATNVGFLGTSVVSGSATAVVVGTGDDSYFGTLSSSLQTDSGATAFDAGIRRVSYTLVTFMALMVPLVFVINGLTKDWTSAFLFAVTTAVGLTPEMLPLIVTATMTKGARAMAQRKVVVKKIASIANLGAMSVLATDKTGTLTEDHMTLDAAVGLSGNDSTLTMRRATLNAAFQTGLRNLLDAAILDAAGPDTIAEIIATNRLVDEIPFDFDRRRLSVVVDDGEPDRLIVTKGAWDEMLAVCRYAEFRGVAHLIDDALRRRLQYIVDEHNRRGLRVLAVASARVEHRDRYSPADETGLTLHGLLTFLDPPKATAAQAIYELADAGVEVKVITGDTPLVASSVCRAVGLDPGNPVLGAATDELTLPQLHELAVATTLFAKVSPTQKARIVEAMRSGGTTVGFLGDGINDAAALRTADVGISVDTAVDIAKEAADIILLEKDLTVLRHGVVEGRRTLVNAMKYIKMTASSNFGNVFSVLAASALLPFLPMIPLVVLVQNLAYDLSMLTLPWDSVDADDVRGPRRWDSKSLAPFMIRIGPVSSIFDLSTFALMWFVFGADTPGHAALFQSGWFVESIISQTLIVHLLRSATSSPRLSRASRPVLIATALVCLFGLVLPFSGWGQGLGLVPLPWSYFPWLAATLAVYCAVVVYAKRRFIRRYRTWI